MSGILHTSPSANDRRLTLLTIFAAFVAVVVLVLLPILVPKMLSTASATKEIKRGNTISGCRAGYRARVDDASSKLQTSRVAIDAATSEALSAIAVRDADAFRAAASRGDRARVAELKAAGELERATDRYADLIRQSREHPGDFLARCRSEAP